MQTSPPKATTQYPLEDEKFWATHKELLKSSGLSRKAYCRQNNVNYDRFGYWLHKITGGPSSLIAIKLKPTHEPLPSAHDVLCTLSTNNGWDLKIHDLQALSIVLEKVGK